jgi:hypothetical protein
MFACAKLSNYFEVVAVCVILYVKYRKIGKISLSRHYRTTHATMQNAIIVYLI